MIDYSLEIRRKTKEAERAISDATAKQNSLKISVSKMRAIVAEYQSEVKLADGNVKNAQEKALKWKNELDKQQAKQIEIENEYRKVSEELDKVSRELTKFQRELTEMTNRMEAERRIANKNNPSGTQNMQQRRSGGIFG